MRAPRDVDGRDFLAWQRGYQPDVDRDDGLLLPAVQDDGLDPKCFGTHSLRRTKATLIYRRTGNLRAVQLLLGHTKVESTVRYLGIEVDDALAMAEEVDI